MAELLSITQAIEALLARGAPADAFNLHLDAFRDESGVIHSRRSHGKQLKTVVRMTGADLVGSRLCKCFSFSRAHGSSPWSLGHSIQDVELRVREFDRLIDDLRRTELLSPADLRRRDRQELAVELNDQSKSMNAARSIVRSRQLPEAFDQFLVGLEGELDEVVGRWQKRALADGMAAGLHRLAVPVLSVCDFDGPEFDRVSRLLQQPELELRRLIMNLWWSDEMVSPSHRRDLLSRRVRELATSGKLSPLLERSSQLSFTTSESYDGGESVSSWARRVWTDEVIAAFDRAADVLAVTEERLAEDGRLVLCGYGASSAWETNELEIAHAVLEEAGIVEPTIGMLFVLPASVAHLARVVSSLETVDVGPSLDASVLETTRVLWEPESSGPLQSLAAAYAAASRV
jgi:hypothetical protein